LIKLNWEMNLFLINIKEIIRGKPNKNWCYLFVY
jgi:hypothetical protein